MLEEIRNIKSEKENLQKFGITIAVIFLIIAGLLFWKEKLFFQIFLTIGIVFCVIGLAIPVILKPIYWIWIIFTAVLAWVMIRVILSLMFYIIITPIGGVLRLCGIQFLGLKKNHSQQSYWNMRKSETFKKTYE